MNFAAHCESYSELAGQADVVIVEGAGGFLVPLNDEQDSADLARATGSAGYSGGGHAAGLLESCAAHGGGDRRARSGAGGLGGQCGGCGHGDAVEENIAALQQRIAAPLLGVVPLLPQPDASVAAAHLSLDRLAG